MNVRSWSSLFQSGAGSMAANEDEQAVQDQEGYQLLWRMRGGLEDVLLGKPDTVRLAMTALLAGGHLLLEDVPGVGKTVLARAFAKAVGGSSDESSSPRIYSPPT